MILRDRARNVGPKNPNGPSSSTNDDDESSFKEPGWEKITRIIKSKEVLFIVLALILGNFTSHNFWLQLFSKNISLCRA